MTTKIDRRRNYILLIDTETCPIDRTIEGVDPSNMLVYDIGYRIIDKYGNCYLERSFIVDEIFFGEYQKMRNGYYYNKLPKYFLDLGNLNIEHLPFNDIVQIVRQDIADYRIKNICAHNARFDCLALSTTTKYLGCDYLLPYDIEWWDTMKMVKTTICAKKSYRQFCESNGYMTKHKTPRPQTKAEVLYRFITNDTDFVEEHRAIYDARIESKILAECFRTHKKMEKNLWK